MSKGLFAAAVDAANMGGRDGGNAGGDGGDAAATVAKVQSGMFLELSSVVGGIEEGDQLLAGSAAPLSAETQQAQLGRDMVEQNELVLKATQDKKGCIV